MVKMIYQLISPISMKTLMLRLLLLRLMRPFTVALMLFVSLSCASHATNESQRSDLLMSTNATVEAVVDGDTIVARIYGSRETVRLIGINTPESVSRSHPVQCFGAEASTYLRSLLPEGTPITLFLDQSARDRYDRLLAYVFRSVDELFVNHNLVEQGFADTLWYPPNTHFRTLLNTAVSQAKQSQRGLWAACGGAGVPLN